MNIVYSSDGGINGGLGSAFQVTLDGTNGTLRFFGFSKGDRFTLILKQDATGGRTVTFPTTVNWTAKAAPGLDTAANAATLLTFEYDGTNFRDVSGAPSRLPARITAIALATMALVGTGSGVKYVFSNGNGEGPGGITQTINITTNSGSQVNGKIDASGSFLTGSGVQVVGAIVENPAQSLGSVVEKVRGGVKSTNGSGTVVLNGAKGGQICYADTDGTGYTECSGNNGTVTCKVAVGNECP